MLPATRQNWGSRKINRFTEGHRNRPDLIGQDNIQVSALLGVGTATALDAQRADIRRCTEAGTLDITNRALAHELIAQWKAPRHPAATSEASSAEEFAPEPLEPATPMYQRHGSLKADRTRPYIGYRAQLQPAVRGTEVVQCRVKVEPLIKAAPMLDD